MVFVTCAKDILVRRGCQLEEIAEFCRRRHHRQLVVVVRREFWCWFCVGSNDWMDGEGRRTRTIVHVLDLEGSERLLELDLEHHALLLLLAAHKEIVEEEAIALLGGLAVGLDEEHTAFVDVAPMWQRKLRRAGDAVLDVDDLVDVLALLGSETGVKLNVAQRLQCIREMRKVSMCRRSTREYILRMNERESVSVNERERERERASE